MAEMSNSPLDEANGTPKSDIFERNSFVSGEESSLKEIDEVHSPDAISEGFDELPIELISLVDRFIESLGAKVYNTPPSIDKLSSIFQDFYVKAESHTATHITALSTQLSRVTSPSISRVVPPPRTSSRDKLAPQANPGPEQQMLTRQEILDRRKARRLLNRKALAMTEAVEKRVCEHLYSRIWRHRSTLDEVRDEKLRSRTAALALVGIGLRDLGVDMEPSKAQMGSGLDIESSIMKARDGLRRMNDAKYPLGKLRQLAAAHKIIVDLLTTFHQGSSSADEILPTLIYTLITAPPEGINVISNLHFIQRFRASSKVDGEAAYCLTNLEAAITFLETVDLASLRSDECLEGPSPSKSSSSLPVTPERHGEAAPAIGASVPATASSPPYTTDVGNLANNLTETHNSEPASHVTGLAPRPTPHQRRISDLFQPHSAAIEAAGDAVRNTADQGIKSIGSALDNSFKLLFGRLGEHKVAAAAPDTTKSIVVPKTLDDARKLVEARPAEDDDLLSSASSTVEKPEDEVSTSFKSDDGLLSAIAGRKQPHDRSVDSNIGSKPAQQELLFAGNAAVDSMRSLGNSFNPLKGFGGMSVIRGFGRSSSSGTPIPTLVEPTVMDKSTQGQQSSSSPDKGTPAGTKTLPPIERFMDIVDAKELRLGEVSELLQDYKRLAEALRVMGAFQ
ncbi:MAG: hypothetical protein Q9163_003993 [Psora crenata]